MNTSVAAASEPTSSPQSTPVVTSHPTHSFYWSVRREIWENRSIYIAPLIVAGVVLFGFLATLHGLPARRRAALLLDPLLQRAAIAMPYNMAAMMIIFTAIIVGIFYSLDALYGERRDRSILFWKSLPVSDLITVLSKAIIPLGILPLVTFLVIVVTQLVMLLGSSAILLMNDVSPASTWTSFPIFEESLILLYGLVALVLWHAPIYGWLLLVSGVVGRATFLWAVLPPLVIVVFEKITFNTWHVAAMLRHRLIGFAGEAFDLEPPGYGESIYSMTKLTPGNYLSSSTLWMGLIFAVACLALAIRLRRERGPL
jgi:ABC-2 type transport system permease protein